MSEIQLIHGDCLQEMGSIEDGSIDLILCDLPYGTTACKWDTVIPFPDLWSHYKRVIKRNGAIVLTASQPFTSLLVCSNLPWFKHDWVWNKVKPSNYLNARIEPMRSHESVVVFAESRIPYFPVMTTGEWREKQPKQRRPFRDYAYGKIKDGDGNYNNQYYPKSILTISNAHNSGKIHPTQKPVALMEYLIRTYTNEGETVLDNCFGSGTTGVACIQTGRNFIGIEKDPEYFCIAQKRIADAQAQGMLTV